MLTCGDFCGPHRPVRTTARHRPEVPRSSRMRPGRGLMSRCIVGDQRRGAYASTRRRSNLRKRTSAPSAATRAATPARSASSRNRRTSRRSRARACSGRYRPRRRHQRPRGVGAGPAEHRLLAHEPSRRQDGAELSGPAGDVERSRGDVPTSRACSPRWALNLAPGGEPAHGRRPGWTR